MAIVKDYVVPTGIVPRPSWRPSARDMSAGPDPDEAICTEYPHCGCEYGCRQKEDKVEKPLDTQVGGRHYKDMAIQPLEYIMANKLEFAEGCIIKYVSRWRAKGGIEDLRKAAHFIDVLIDENTPNPFD